MIGVRKPGRAVVTVPSDLLNQGTRLRRYSLDELQEGMTPEHAAQLNEETVWAREGAPIGRELL